LPQPEEHHFWRAGGTEEHAAARRLALGERDGLGRRQLDRRPGDDSAQDQPRVGGGRSLVAPPARVDEGRDKRRETGVVDHRDGGLDRALPASARVEHDVHGIAESAHFGEAPALRLDVADPPLLR
jgi:hypothetical protein